MNLSLMLVSKLESYLNESLSREDFSIWVYALSRSAEKCFSREDLDFIQEVEGIFSEASSGGWSQSDLASELEAALTSYVKTRNILEFTE